MAKEHRTARANQGHASGSATQKRKTSILARPEKASSAESKLLRTTLMIETRS